MIKAPITLFEIEQAERTCYISLKDYKELHKFYCSVGLNSVMSHDYAIGVLRTWGRDGSR
jgi:hypothetical protein